MRLAQSIGLHVDDSQRPVPDDSAHGAAQEMRRRVWYSIYVLDRLLALQLGRPPAIHDGDFDVGLPLQESDVAVSNGPAIQRGGSNDDQVALLGNYFLAMIQFSQIIGRVFYALYGPSKVESAQTALSMIETLDEELLQWSRALPRSLRFDLAHTFESSITFKRQVSDKKGPRMYL